MAPFRQALIAALLGAPLASAAAPVDAGPSLAGTWTGPGGARLELAQDGAKVSGRLSAEGGPCPLPAGTEVLHGGVLDDSLSAMVRVCLLSTSCAADPGEALAILLVTRQLTGGVHAKAACAAEVKSLVLRRPGAVLAIAAPRPDERLSAAPATTVASQGERLAGLPAAPAREGAGAAMPETEKGGKQARADETPPGQIPGRPVGGPHGDGYDPRDARPPATVRGQADRLMRRAQAFLSTGEFEKARKLFREAVAKEPARAEAYNGVGVTFYGRNDWPEALAWYKRALEADPRFGDAYYNLACIYALQGHKALAFRYLRLAALNHYSERKQLEEDPDLEALRGEPEMKEILDQMTAEPKPSQPKGARRP